VSNVVPPPAPTRALLDTTVQVDRVKTGARKAHLDRLLATFDWKLAASMSVVEFKATIIQECINIHNQLRLRGRLTAVRDALIEKDHPQRALRAHVFNNLITVYAPSSFTIDDAQDARLAEKARIRLERVIPGLYEWFVAKSVDSILRDRLECNRANEPPRKKRAAFETNLPICRRGKNKSCRVEAVIREAAPALLPALRTVAASSEQVTRAVGVFDSVIANAKSDLSHGDCRRAGDCLIALEGQGSATHALSSNAREWDPLSKLMGFSFVHVTYPEEKSR